jgi:hypothetical protein
VDRDSIDLSRFLQPGDSLFRFGPRREGPPRWVKLSAAYKDAADQLVNVAEREDHADSAATYPIVFLYRHFIELELKSILALAMIRSKVKHPLEETERVIGKHDLGFLCDVLLRSEFMQFLESETQLGSVLTTMRDVVKELCSYDPSSTVFRYPVDKGLVPHDVDLSGLSINNLRHVAQKLEFTFRILRRVLEEGLGGGDFEDEFEDGTDYYRREYGIPETKMNLKDILGIAEMEAEAEESGDDPEAEIRLKDLLDIAEMEAEEDG